MVVSQDNEKICQALSNSPFFEDFEDGELRRLVEACEPMTVAPRLALWAVGSRGDAAYILVDGRIEVSHRFPPDGHRVDQISEVGHLLALPYLVRDWPHESAATALEKSLLLRLKRQDFEQLFESGETAAYRLVDHLAEALVSEMRDANRRLHSVFGNPAETLRTLRRRVRQT